MNFNNFTQELEVGIVNVCKAVLLLCLAFIVAAIVKSIVLKLLMNQKISNFLDKADGEKDGNSGDARNYIAQIVYLFVFLLFVPGIFGLLGITTIGEPILELLNNVWGYVPNIIAAIIVIIVGNLIAKIVRQLLIPLFRRLKIDKLQEKAGVQATENAKLSTTLAYIVYVVILIPVIVVALQVLHIDSITGPAVAMLHTIFNFIPNIIVAILIITLGVMLSKLAAQILTQLLSTAGVDDKVKGILGEKGQNFSFTKTLATLVRALIIIFFVVQGCNVLHMEILTNIGESIIRYLPNILAAILVLMVAFFGINAICKLLIKNGMKGLTLPVKIIVWCFAGFMVLSQLGIANHIVHSAFLLILVALAVAFGISFGIGGKDAAKRIMDGFVDKVENEDEKTEKK
ncbi:MAG: mechanosensitive ion channel [Lachnospiraceae bacterium]|nr:mechanosensitive ion channel [Lachnospiraceae bacterium]